MNGGGRILSPVPVNKGGRILCPVPVTKGGRILCQGPGNKGGRIPCQIPVGLAGDANQYGQRASCIDSAEHRALGPRRKAATLPRRSAKNQRPRHRCGGSRPGRQRGSSREDRRRSRRCSRRSRCRASPRRACHRTMALERVARQGRAEAGSECRKRTPGWRTTHGGRHHGRQHPAGTRQNGQPAGIVRGPRRSSPGRGRGQWQMMEVGNVGSHWESKINEPSRPERRRRQKR